MSAPTCCARGAATARLCVRERSRAIRANSIEATAAMSSLVDRKLAELEGIDTPSLRALWEEAYGRPPPKSLRRDLLLRALAYHVQERAYGGLSKTARKQLARLANANSGGTVPPNPAPPRLKPGTRLLREWGGVVHQVTVLEDGFEHRDSRYASLSQIAREITGARWSGPRFFGLRDSGR